MYKVVGKTPKNRNVYVRLFKNGRIGKPVIKKKEGHIYVYKRYTGKITKRGWNKSMSGGDPIYNRAKELFLKDYGDLNEENANDLWLKLKINDKDTFNKYILRGYNEIHETKFKERPNPPQLRRYKVRMDKKVLSPIMEVPLDTKKVIEIQLLPKSKLKYWRFFEGCSMLNESWYNYISKTLNTTCTYLPDYISLDKLVSDSVTKKLVMKLKKCGHPYLVQMYRFDTRDILREYRRVESVHPLWKYNINGIIEGGGHANMLIFDINRKKVIHFDPHGIRSMAESEYRKLKTWVANNLKEWKYLNPKTVCPYIGPQSREDKTSRQEFIEKYGEIFGYCAAWSLMFSHLYLLNPELDEREINEYMYTWSKNKVTWNIRRYAEFLVLELFDFIKGKMVYDIIRKEVFKITDVTLESSSIRLKTSVYNKGKEYFKPTMKKEVIIRKTGTGNGINLCGMFVLDTVATKKIMDKWRKYKGQESPSFSSYSKSPSSSSISPTLSSERRHRLSGTITPYTSTSSS